MALKKIQTYLFYALVILLPSQLGRHFWPDFALISGVKIDYFSPTLYLTDLLILGLVFCQIPLLLKNFTFDATKLKKTLLIAVILIGVAIVNISISLSPAVSTYKWLKVFEIIFLAWFVATHVKSNKNIGRVATLLLIPVLYEAVLIFWQFWSQGSIDGWWWFFGERTFNTNTVGIANAVINGVLVLRPYGTFSHPNVAAGFLAVVLPLIIYCFSLKNGFFPHKYRKISATILSLGFGALLLTLSRSAIIVGSGGIIASLANKTRKMGLAVGIVAFGLVIVGFGIVRQGEESVVVREKLNRLAVVNFERSPVFGTGLGTSPLYQSSEIRIANYALQNQPTHNSYLLVLGETGIVGLVIVVGVSGMAVRKLVREKRWGLLTPLVSILVLGLFDHYFLTLQQGQVLLGLIFGLAFAKIDG